MHRPVGCEIWNPRSVAARFKDAVGATVASEIHACARQRRLHPTVRRRTREFGDAIKIHLIAGHRSRAHRHARHRETIFPVLAAAIAPTCLRRVGRWMHHNAQARDRRALLGELRGRFLRWFERHIEREKRHRTLHARESLIDDFESASRIGRTHARHARWIKREVLTARAKFREFACFPRRKGAWIGIRHALFKLRDPHP